MDQNTIYKNSEVCQTCAKCCKNWVTYAHSKDDVLRIQWLDTDKIEVVKIREDLWKIIFDIRCKQLIKKNGLYYCKAYHDIRPLFCEIYPNNFRGQDEDIIEMESKICPIMKEVLGKSNGR